MQDPILLCVLVWKGYKKSLVIETRKTRSTKSNSEAQRRYLSRPNGESCTRADRPDGGLPNETTL